MQNTDEQIRKMLELKETIIEKMSKFGTLVPKNSHFGKYLQFFNTID